MGEFTALGVYIFAGGFTLGMRKHFRILGHLEDGPFGTKTVKKNMPDLPIEMQPVHWFNAYHAMMSPQGFTERGNPDVIYGNPPCAPWSAAGHLPNQTRKLELRGVKAKYEADPRVECVRKQFGLLATLKPKIWVWESVARAYTVGRPFVDELAHAANEQGYHVYLVRVDGAWTGLPQRRRRFFFVASKVVIPWQHPGKTPRTVGEVLGEADYGQPHLETKANVTGALVEFIGDMQPGESGQDAFRRWKASRNEELTRNERGNVIGQPNFLMHRLKYDAICGTIVSGGCLVHPEHDRYLSVQEAQVLCGYPADYEFVGRDAYAQISKAVCPTVGEWLGGNLRRGLEANIAASSFVGEDHQGIHISAVTDINFLKPL